MLSRPGMQKSMCDMARRSASILLNASSQEVRNEYGLLLDGDSANSTYKRTVFRIGYADSTYSDGNMTSST